MDLYAHICWLFVPVMLYRSEMITVFWSWPCRALWEISPAESLHWCIGIWRARTCRRSLLKVRVGTFILACGPNGGSFYIQVAFWSLMRLAKLDKNYQQLFIWHQPLETGSKGADLFSAMSAKKWTHFHLCVWKQRQGKGVLCHVFFCCPVAGTVEPQRFSSKAAEAALSAAAARRAPGALAQQWKLYLSSLLSFIIIVFRWYYILKTLWNMLNYCSKWAWYWRLLILYFAGKKL